MAEKFLLKIITPLLLCLLYQLTPSRPAVPKRPSPFGNDFSDLPSSFKLHLNSRQRSQQQQQQGCRSCNEKKANLSQQELKQLRYGIVKKQILQKLQMTHEPRLRGVSRPALQPLLVAAEMAENATVEERATAEGEEELEKTESIVIYPSEVDATCEETIPYPCVRLQFRLPKDVGIESFASSELWLHKTQSSSHFQLTELALTSDDLVELVDIQQEQTAEEPQEVQWTKYKLPSNVLWSNALTDYVLTMQVKCLSDCPQIGNPIIAETGDDRPFLVIRTVTTKGPTRSRRSVDCIEGSTACCRETFYLNFSEVGWDNWILHPEGYYANFCRGRCVNDLSNMRFYHSAVLISYIQDNDDIAAEMGLNMCCTPSAMSPVSIIYMNEEGLIYHKSIENMKVEACDCA